MWPGDIRKPARISRVGEAAIPVILVQRVGLIAEVGNEQIWQTVIVVIGEVHAHAGVCRPVPVHGHSRHQAHFFKCAVTLIVIEEFEHRVIGDANIQAAVAVVVGKRDS